MRERVWNEHHRSIISGREEALTSAWRDSGQHGVGRSSWISRRWFLVRIHRKIGTIFHHCILHSFSSSAAIGLFGHAAIEIGGLQMN